MSIKQIIIGVLFLSFVFSCNKKAENAEAMMSLDLGEEMVVDTLLEPISMAATQEVEGKKFVKTANVNLEVKEVYQATISIENKLKELGGFVTSSQLNSSILNEKMYPVSDEKAILVREYYTENKMQVRVPTIHLGDFLQFVSDKKVFLHHRHIISEDVTANIKMAQMEKERLAKKQGQINQLPITGKNIEQSDENIFENNIQKVSEINLQDNLKYSTVDIYIREPKNRVAEIEVTNSKSSADKYKYDFWYDIKSAFVDGFYIFQRVLIALATVWPLFLVGFLGVYLWRNKKSIKDKFTKKNKE